MLISVSVYAGRKGSLQAPLPQLKKADSAPDSNDTSPLPDIKTIEPVPEVKMLKPEDLFTGRGIIDRIGTNDIVLGDEQFDIAPDAEFFSETGKPILKSAFQKGDHVGYRSEKFYEINALWKIKNVKK
jgi:hypothetical protein